jgi:hypothetical protein
LYGLRYAGEGDQHGAAGASRPNPCHGAPARAVGVSALPSDPILRLAMTLRVDCTPFEIVGDMGRGVRRIQNLTGGTFEIPAQTGGTFSTPAVKGTVLNARSEKNVQHLLFLSSITAALIPKI